MQPRRQALGAPLGASYRQQGGPRGGRLVRVWLFPDKDPLEVLPDLPVEHAVEQEDEEALGRGAAGQQRSQALWPQH